MLRKFFLDLADRQLDKLLPAVEKKLDDLRDKAVAAIQAEIEKRIPMIIEAVVVAVTKSMGQLAVNTSDKITDFIPGQVDDAIIDPLVRNVVDEIKTRFGIRF